MVINQEFANWVVLVVDDEPDNIGVAEKILSFYGATVHVAHDGLEGLHLLETVTPTFILLDLSMPNMDGWEMLKEVRKDLRWLHVPVIALTAHAMAGDRDRVMDAGFDDYIAKPFHLTSFLEDIRRCMRTLGRLPVAE